jgi:hypothetical protein
VVCGREFHGTRKLAATIFKRLIRTVSSGNVHYCEFVSDPEPIPRVPEIGIQTAILYRSVSVIAHTMRSTRLWRDSGLSFERAAVGTWIALGAAEEVVAT